MGLFDFFKRKPAPAPVAPSSPAPQNVPDGRELLMREAEAVLRADPGNDSVTRLTDDLGFALERGGSKRHVYLHNLFAETRDMSPEARRGRVLFFLQSLTEDGTDDEGWDEVQPRLRVVVRASTANVLVVPEKAELNLPTAKPFLPELNLLVAIDRPTSMAYVGQSHLETWAVPVEEIFGAAQRNLSAFSTGTEVYDRSHGTVLTLAEGDDYAASRLCIPGWLAGLRGQVEGRPLAIVPERSTVLVGGDANPELIRWLAETAQREYQAAPRAISPAVYTVDDAGAVVPYLRPGREPLDRLVQRGHALLRGREYADQKGLLETLHERAELDVFVATCTLSQLEGGRVVSYAVWPDGIDALLPHVDALIVSGGQPKTPSAWMALVPFERARAIAANLIRDGEVKFGPARLRVSGAFSEEQKRAFLAATTKLEELPE
jgi:hypothetical protein